jgi:cobalt-zinc-cadmium efflux system outer membrane protein
LKTMQNKSYRELRNMNLAGKILVSVFLIFTAMNTSAQKISLDSVLLLIDKQNPMLAAYNDKIKAANAYAEGATSWMAPMVGAGTFMTPYPGRRVTEQRDKGFVMFSVEQNIPNPAKLQANRSWLQSKEAIGQDARSYAFNTLRAEAKANYLQWIVLEKKLKILQDNKTRIELLKQLAEVRFTHNQGSLGNVYKAEARIQETENAILETRANIEEKSYRLKTLMNLPASTTMSIDTTVDALFYQFNIREDTLSLRSKRSDVKQIDSEIQSMRYNLRLQQYQRKPDFKISYNHMSPIGNSMPNQFTLMGMISIPIAPWSSKMYRAEVKGMEYDIDALQKEREAKLREANGTLLQMASQLKRIQQQLTSYKTKIIPALKRNYETLQLAYEQNREQLPMVLDGWEALNMAQMEELEKLESYLLMLVNYEKEIEK